MPVCSTPPALAESFISLISSLSQLGEIPSVGFFVLIFVVSFSIWSIYFLTVMPTGLPEKLGNLRVWVLARPLLIFAVVTVSTEFANLSRIDFSVSFAPEGLEWSPLPILMVWVVILVIVATQKHGGLPRRRALQTQSVAVAAVGALYVLDWFAPEAGVPWYLVAAAIVIAIDAIVLAVLGRVRQ
jgi:hypothetical protein